MEPLNYPNKITIARSFSRKINLGNYESADFFSSRSETVDSDYDPAHVDELSVDLYEKCKEDVEQSIAEFLSKTQCNYAAVKRLVDAISVGNPGSMEDYEALNPAEQALVQSVKRAYKRSDMAKEEVETRKGLHQ